MLKNPCKRLTDQSGVLEMLTFGPVDSNRLLFVNQLHETAIISFHFTFLPQRKPPSDPQPAMTVGTVKKSPNPLLFIARTLKITQ